MPTYERLDYGSPDGSHWGGASSDPLGMYGVTPVTRQAVGANVSTTSATTQIFTLVSSLVEALKTIGIVRT